MCNIKILFSSLDLDLETLLSKIDSEVFRSQVQRIVYNGATCTEEGVRCYMAKD